MVMGSPHDDDEFVFARKLVLDVGKIIRNGYPLQKYFHGQTSHADVVTDLDRDLDVFIEKEIHQRFPEHNIISEESCKDVCVLTDNPTWIVDPIDGSVNFMAEYPCVCVSLALYVDKKPTIAMVYNPILNCLYDGQKDCGAFLNDEKIQVDKSKSLRDCLIFTDWSIDLTAEGIAAQTQNMCELAMHTRGIRSLGSTAFEMCQVATGCGDIFFDFGIHCWNYAAAVLIVEEAGGYCCSYDGSPVNLMSRNVVCAATPALAQQVTGLLKPIFHTPDV